MREQKDKNSRGFIARLRKAHILYIGVALVVVTSSIWMIGRNDAVSYAATWPETPPAQICGDTGVLDGPSSAPGGATTVPAGNNTGFDFDNANTTYWFAPGVHTFDIAVPDDDQYIQIKPGNNSRFVGAPGAILDGQKVNKYAFGDHGTNVTIEHLTIRNFGPVGSNNNEGVVNHDAGDGWIIQYNTVTGNAGAGVFVGTDNVLRYNCLTSNEQYGFSAYEPAGPSNVTMDHNEISYNNTYDWESYIDGCGCTGGGKFWEVTNATVTNNYVHHNHSVGLWADNNNAGFLYENNYISDNESVGIFYETSYNALIRNNTLIRNGLTQGPDNPGFPTSAIYLSEAGSDNRVDTPYNTTLEITGNLMEDNWGGVILWENADRYCGSPSNTSTGECTRVNPTVVTDASCNAANINNAPYYEDCRWKTKNVKVHDNTFKSTPANIGASCTFANSCGYNGVFSNWGTWPLWSPYMGTTVETAITHNQNNTFYNNTYEGAWQFMAMEQGNDRTFGQWRASPFNQDAGSTLNAAPTNAAPTVTVTAPLDGATVSGTVPITATAADDASVAGVQFKEDGTNFGSEDTSFPYGTSLNTTTLTNGSHAISATVRDGPGLTTTSTVTVTVANATKQGDINSDNSVNVLDLSVLLSNWGRTSSTWTNPKCDINADGTVTVLDLSVLLSKWGT